MMKGMRFYSDVLQVLEKLLDVWNQHGSDDKVIPPFKFCLIFTDRYLSVVESG